MINKFKKNTCKFTAVTLSTALLVGGIALTNPLKVRAANDLSNNSMQVLKDLNKDIIENMLKDSKCNRYNNLDRLVGDVDFNFMIPAYIPDNNYHVTDFKWYTQDKRVRLSYSNMKNGQGFYYDLRISPIDPELNLGKEFEDDKKIDRCSKNMEDVQGEILTTKRHNRLRKYFVYKKDGIYYDIEYQRMDENNNVDRELSESEVAKIIKSLKNPEEVNKDAYDLSNEFIRLYDMEDLKATREMVGFNFKVPMDNFFSKCSEISSSDKKYISFLFIDGVDLYQSTEIPYYYDQFNKNGKLEMADSEKSWFDKMEGTWEYINDKKVLKIVNTYELLPEEKLKNVEPDKDVDYTWFDDGIYYSVSSNDCDNMDNIDEIISHIMDSKSYDEIMK